MHIEMAKGHMEQIKTRWRGNEDSANYNIVRVTFPDEGGRFQGYSGARYLAYPSKPVSNIPLMVFLDGIERHMTGTVWMPQRESKVSVERLFDVIIPGHQCGSTQLCSVQTNGLTFWPHDFEVTHGLYVNAKQVDIREEQWEGSDLALCSTTVSSSRGSNNSIETEPDDGESGHATIGKDDDHAEEEQEEAFFFQVSFSAGSFPDRVQEQSHELHYRIEQVRNNAREQWELEREIVNRDVRLTGQIELSEEMNALRQRRGNHRIFLYGIMAQYLGMEIMDINWLEVEDVTDLVVMVRRVWMRRFPVFLMHVSFIDPQIPPIALQGQDGVSLLCDLTPREWGIPVVIMSMTSFPGDEPTTFDASAHRVGELENCDALLRVTGFTFICEFNARCVCHHASRQIQWMPIHISAGMRLDVALDFDQGQCQGKEDEAHEHHHEDEGSGGENATEDHMVLMQSDRAGSTGAWLLGYLLNGLDTLRVWDSGTSGQRPEEILTAHWCAISPWLTPGEIKVHEVIPQPKELGDVNAKAFVVANKQEVHPWQALILTDLVWLLEAEDDTGAAPASENVWRAAKIVDFQISLREFYEQIGISVFCLPNPQDCKTRIHDFP